MRNASTGAGLAGWVVDVVGPVNASVTTNANGVYFFSGLPAGTYAVCEELQSGWDEVMPPLSVSACASGLGYLFDVGPGGAADFVDFGNQLL